MVAMLALAAAPVLVSRILSRDALASSASNAVPSWNLTPLRRFSFNCIPSLLKIHDVAKPPLIAFLAPISIKLP